MGTLDFISAKCMDPGMALRVLKFIQVSCLVWLLFWIGILVYHLWIADLLMPSPNTSDTYYVVYYFGGLALSIYAALIVVFVSTLLLRRAKRERQ